MKDDLDENLSEVGLIHYKMKNVLFTLLVLFGMSLGFPQDNYELSSESVLTVDGTSTLHAWSVTANTFTGALQLEENTIKEISFEVEVASLISPRGATMDKKTHNALKKEEHPKVLFSANDISLSEGDSQNILGKLTMAGVEKEVVVVTTIVRSEGKLQITGNQKITLQDYNMEPPTAMFGSIIVGDDVVINFDLVFAK
jgi:polyisoprenoid-binding protein YceI